MNTVLILALIFIPGMVGIGAVLVRIPGRALHVTTLMLQLLTTAICAYFVFATAPSSAETGPLFASTVVRKVSRVWNLNAVFRIDYYSALLLFCMNIAMLLAVVSERESFSSRRSKLSAFLILQAAVTGAFASTIMHQFLFFQAAAIFPAVLLIGWDVSEMRFQTAKRVGLQLMLACLLLLACVLLDSERFRTGIQDWFRLGNSEYEILFGPLYCLLFLLFVFLQQFLFPFHSALAGAFKLKNLAHMMPMVFVSQMGFYALFRFGNALHGEQLQEFVPAVLFVAAFSLFYFVLQIFRRWNPREFIVCIFQCYSAIMMMGFWSGGSMGVTAACGLSLFLSLAVCSGLLMVVFEERRNAFFYMRDISRAPAFGGSFAFQYVVMFGMPVSLGFYSCLYVYWSLWTSHPRFAFVAVLFVPILFFAAARGLFREPGNHGRAGSFADLQSEEKIAILPLQVILMLTGIFPGVVLDQIGRSIKFAAELLQRGN